MWVLLTACYPFDPVIRDCTLGNNSGWFFKWFIDVKTWESFELASPNTHWVCLRGVSLSYWYEAFFSFVGMELGHFVELSPVTFNKVNFSEA